MVAAGPSLCARCGPCQSNILFNPHSGARQRVCRLCLSPSIVTLGRLPTPNCCPECGVGDLGWRHPQTAAWSDGERCGEDIGGHWITAEFDGDYSGVPASAESQSALCKRSYHFVIEDCRLSKVRSVRTPPAPISDAGVVPLRLSKLGPVLFSYRDAEVGPERLYSVVLYDFRLHEWDHASCEEQTGGKVELVGRLWGTAYGRLTPPMLQHVGSEKAANDNLVAPAESNRMVEPPKLTGNGNPVTGSVAARIESRSSATQFVRATRPRWTERVKQAIRRWYPNGVSSPSLWRWLAGLFVGTWLVFGVTPALWFAGASLIYYLLSKGQFFRSWRQFSDPRWRLWVAAVIAAFAVWALVQLLNVGCNDSPIAWLIPLVALLAFSAWFRLHILALLSGLIFATLFLLQQNDAVRCGTSVAPNARVVRPGLAQHFENTAVRVATDHDAEAVAAQPSAAAEHRISIDQAIDDPEKYFSCSRQSLSTDSAPFEIYFGESALFSFRENQLGPNSEAHLQKIAQLLRERPQAKIVLTGHSDQVGATLANLKLSEQRAQNVADWLVKNGVLSREQIDVRGEGDRHPVVSDRALYRLNRRVEIRIDCSSEVRGHQ